MNAHLGDGLRDGEIFYSLAEARMVIGSWRRIQVRLCWTFSWFALVATGRREPHSFEEILGSLARTSVAKEHSAGTVTTFADVTRTNDNGHRLHERRQGRIGCEASPAVRPAPALPMTCRDHAASCPTTRDTNWRTPACRDRRRSSRSIAAPSASSGATLATATLDVFALLRRREGDRRLKGAIWSEGERIVD